VLLAGRDRFVSSHSRTTKAPDPRAVANQGQTEVNQQRVQGQAQKSDRERSVQKMGGTNMIEAMKQAAEDVSKAYDVLAFAHTERALELLAKTRTSLRQAIAGLESQERNFCPRCGKRTNDIHTCTPPQRTWVGLTDEEILKSEWAIGANDVLLNFARAIEAKLKEKNNA
jgi:hypothetical protein